MTIDMKKLSDMPSKLIATCKQALETRREFIEWFENLKNQEKGCSKSILSKKINEFNAENDMLSSSLRNQENEFLKEISDFIRTCWNQTIACQLRNEDLTSELSKLDSLNMELKKQINNFEHQKSYTSKIRVEGLEKELKEEKMKRKSMKDRLTRTEGQIRINEERATLLESALNEARAQTRVLERTKQQLLEKNQQLQQELNTELNKVNECLKKNTIQLQEIALAKETLQAEKEDLKSKLEELSNHYNESINNMKQELNKKTANLIDTEKRYNDEMERNNQLQATIESQSSHLEDLSFRCTETVKKLKEKESELDELVNYKSELEQLKQELDEKNTEIEKYKKHIFEHANALKELEKQFQEANEQGTKLKSDIKNKTEYIRELEMKQHILVQQSQENESKMEIYEEQLLTLKSHITKLKEHFGEFEDLNDLNELIKQQNSILNDTRRKNSELLREVEEKKETLKHLTDTIDKQEKTIKEKRNILNMISEKQAEQKNTVQLNEQIDKKNAEIETLINSIESKKERIEQLEKIIITLEDENHKAYIQQQRDQNKIHALEKRIIYYEHCNIHRNNNIPSDDLDSIIKILEHELETQDESELITTDRNYNNIRPNENIGDCHKDNLRIKETFFQKENNNTGTKNTVGNFIDINKISNKKYKIENLGRKQAITKIDTQKWTPNINSKSYFPSVSLIDNERVHKEENRSIDKFRLPKEKLRNIQYFELNQARDQKKDKMFKFASHQL
ncbi:unnamed protein product [Euphydryas editha]|nr:unnamed protein product [Euphydryas editha]